MQLIVIPTLQDTVMSEMKHDSPAEGQKRSLADTGNREEPGARRKRLATLLRTGREVRFAVETVKKLFVFMVIALSAVGIHKMVEALNEHQMSSVFISGLLTLVEHAMLLIDAAWLILFLVLEAAQAITEQMKTLVLKALAAATLLAFGMTAGTYLKMCLTELLRLLISQTR